MSIFLFDEPLRATVNTDDWPLESESSEVMLMGFTVAEGKTNVAAQMYGVVTTAEGKVVQIPTEAITTQWRYLVESDQWVDINLYQEAQQP